VEKIGLQSVNVNAGSKCS